MDFNFSPPFESHFFWLMEKLDIFNVPQFCNSYSFPQMDTAPKLDEENPICRKLIFPRVLFLALHTITNSIIKLIHIVTGFH